MEDENLSIRIKIRFRKKPELELSATNNYTNYQRKVISAPVLSRYKPRSERSRAGLIRCEARKDFCLEPLY